MFEVMYKGLHIRVSLVETGHYINHEHAQPTAYIYIFSIPGNGYHASYNIHPTHECAVLCTICELSEWFDPEIDPYLHLPIVSSLFSEPNPTSCGTQPNEVHCCLTGGPSTIYVFPDKRQC